MSADDSDVTVTAEVEDVDESNATVTRSAGFVETVTEPKDKAFAPGSNQENSPIEYFDKLVEFDAELAGTLRAIAEQGATGMSVTHPASEGPNVEMSSLEKEITTDCERLLYDLDLDVELTSIFKETATHGNSVSHMEYEEGTGVINLSPLPLRALTILDAETRSGLGTGSGVGTSVTDRTISSADYYILDEASDDRQVIPSEEVLHFAQNRRGNWYTDTQGRQTYSVWGERRLEPLKWPLQVKANTLANKVALDDSLLAREYYHINVAELYGHIQSDEQRQQAAENYAEDLRKKLEALDVDEKPILPDEVTVELKSPDGNTAQNMADFVESMNNSIQHGLAFHSASFGRDAGGTLAGNRPAKEMSHNTVRSLRQTIAKEMRRLFEIHAILRYPGARQQPEEFQDPTIGEWVLSDDVVLPELSFEPLESEEETTRFDNAVKAVNGGILTKEEARSYLGYDPELPEELETDNPDAFEEQQEKLKEDTDDEDDENEDDQNEDDEDDGDEQPDSDEDDEDDESDG